MALRILLIVAIAAVVLVPVLSDQLADTASLRKIHFTETITSAQDPGIGYGDRQLASILLPSEGTIYDGSLTYAASAPVQVMILHEIESSQSRGQPVWTIEGEAYYAMSLVGAGVDSGSAEFTGAALALRGITGDEFTATVSVDAWIRGDPVSIVAQPVSSEPEPPGLRLYRSSVSAEIPLHTGLYEGEELLYIITDSSDEDYSSLITEKQGWKVEFAPRLVNATNESTAPVYLFADGIAGEGIHGYQSEVFSSTPEQPDEYSALRLVYDVEWKGGQNPEVLDSEEKILEARDKLRLDIEETDIIVNMAQIKWPEGQLEVRDNSTKYNATRYEGAQITAIDEETMTVTFVAHRGWGPDGGTIYHIITDATPAGPAAMMGVADSPRSADLSSGPAIADIYQFNNGVAGSGPLGFQPVISSVTAGDEDYTPIHQVLIAEWDDPSRASVLTTQADINASRTEEAVMVEPARPLNSEHVINSPLIDPFQEPPLEE